MDTVEEVAIQSLLEQVKHILDQIIVTRLQTHPYLYLIIQIYALNSSSPFILNFMESTKHLGPHIPPSDNQLQDDEYYMGKDSWWMTRKLSFHYFQVLPGYKSHYKKNKFIKYRPQYSRMVNNQYIWHRFRKMGAKFNIFKEVFMAERSPIIAVIIISVIIGVLALFGAYYQRFLFRSIIQEDYHVSGWVFFAIIVTSAILRFFLFNYAQNLANQVAINIRCYLQNALIRVIFHLPEDLNDGLLINNIFVSPNLINNAAKFLPYFISSLVIVCGIVGFIIGIVGTIGWVVLGLTIFFLIIQMFVLKYMLHLHHEYVDASDKRTSLLLLGTQTLLKLTYNGLSHIYLQLVKKYRKKQTSIDRKYNLSDGVIQIMTESISFISVFIFYVLAESSLREDGESDPSYKQILQAVILFSVFKTPIKMVGYGLSIGLEGYAGFDRIRQLLQECEVIEEGMPPKTYPRIYPNPSCFESEHIVEGFQGIKQLRFKSDLVIDKHQGELIMVLGKVDANPDCDEYMKDLEENLHREGRSFCSIGFRPMIQDKSIKENIIFGEPFDAVRYRQVLNVSCLQERIEQFPEKDETKMDENYFKTIFIGLSLKIEIARALYCDVDTMLINRSIFKDYEEILINVRDYRKKKGHTTVVVNLSGAFYELADWLVILDRSSKIQGTYNDLKKKSSILQEFQTMFNENKDKVLTQQIHNSHLSKLKQAPVDHIKVRWTDFFRFYGLTHCGAGFILIVLLLIPPLLDLYLEVVVAESAHDIGGSEGEQVHAFVGATESHEEQLKFDHIITLRYGVAALTFILMNLAKIMGLTIYLRTSAYLIVKRVIESFLTSKIEQTLESSNRKSALNLQRNIESLDTRVTADLDVGITIIFEQMTALIFGAVSSVLFLAIGVPFFIITIIIIGIMVFFNRKILYIRRQTRSKFNSFIKKLVIHRKEYMHYGKNDYIIKEYIRHNTIDIEADFNEEWLMESLGIILQVVFILLLTITIAVSLVKFEEIHEGNQAFLELAISFLIGMTNGARMNLKVFQSMDLQLVGVTSIFKMIEIHETNKTEELKDFPDHRIFTVQFKNFHVRFTDDILDDCSFSFKAGQRIIITGSRRGGKRVAFYALLGIFQPQHISGDIFINRTPIYKNRITRKSLTELIYFLETESLSLVGYSVGEAIKSRAPRRQNDEIQFTLNQIWQVLGIKPLFTIETQVKSLSAPTRDIFALVRAVMVRPQILVIEGGLSHIDTINRKKLTRWLISNNQISIIIDLTNRIEVIEEYPRRMEFVDGKITIDERKSLKYV